MALQKTAHDACSRKVHCVAKGYLDDPFVQYFTKDSTIVNSPLMNRGTWLRTVAIENCVTSFSQSNGGSPIQVINFGAGVDTLYFRLKRFHPDIQLSRLLELDFADLVAEKWRTVQKHDALSSLVSDEYALKACNLREPGDTVALIKSLISPHVPTVLIAEMVFVYIEESITTELLQGTVNLFAPQTEVQLITYDAMQPNDRFGQMMFENLSSIGVVLKGIRDLPTEKEHVARAKKVGFRSVSAMSMRKLYLTVPPPQQQALNKLEMIDDWDEWNLVHDHYCFLVASRNSDENPKVF